MTAPMTREEPTFQKRVVNWLMECFSMEVCRDGTELNHRFLEEALELVQALGCTRSEAHQLVDYVFGRPLGEPLQELGGVMVTLTALANCHDMDLMAAAETELARVWTKIDKIRAKQLAKPKHSPLPEHVHGLAQQPPSEPVKLTYIKRWRTIVKLPASRADEIAEALAAPQQSSRLEREGLIDALVQKFPAAFSIFGNGYTANALCENVTDAIFALLSPDTTAVSSKRQGVQPFDLNDPRPIWEQGLAMPSNHPREVGK